MRSIFGSRAGVVPALRQPAEWEPHAATWVAMPSHANLWKENLAAARAEWLAMCRTIALGEKLEILVPNASAHAFARKALLGLDARFHRIPFGDIWLRDTAPIFVRSGKRLVTARFRFNGWGRKYVLPHDSRVSEKIARKAKLPELRFPFILEGGSVEVDGQGTCLTTRQCLLNRNRNRGMTELKMEHHLRDALGATKTLWLDKGLLNDHTDGHIDTLARFVAPGVVVCMRASGKRDPNRAVLAKIAKDLRRMRDARGRKLEVVTIPSPGRLIDSGRRVLPASYVNFYIANRTVVVPTYGTVYDAEAVAKIAECFPGRRTVGVPARHILAGGGAFHCITQQQPR